MRSLACLAALLAIAPPAVAPAATITVRFTGSVNFTHLALSSPFSVGDPVGGSFQMTTTAIDGLPADPSIGRYVADSTLTFGGYSTASESIDVTVLNGAFDALRLLARSCISPCQMAAGLPFHNFRLLLFDATGTALADDSVPTSLDVADFDASPASLATLTFLDGTIPRDVTAMISTVSVTVPEPGALVLVALAAAGGAARRRGRQPSDR